MIRSLYLVFLFQPKSLILPKVKEKPGFPRPFWMFDV